MIKSLVLVLLTVGLAAPLEAEQLDGNRVMAVDTTFYANAAPSLHVRVIRGVASLAEGADVEDVFPSTTTVTEVVVSIEPPTGLTIDVTATSGPTWTEDPASGIWSATFPMPAAGGTTLGEYAIVVDPDGVDIGCTGKFKVKKTSGAGGGI